MRTLTVLGSTGSIGTNTLDVVRRNRQLYRIYALVAGRNVETLAKQIVEFRPQVAAVATPEALARLTELLDSSDRKSTRLNSSHLGISYAVFCLKKKQKHDKRIDRTVISTKPTDHIQYTRRL